MPRLEQQDFQGGRGFGAERLPLTPAPSVLPAWFGGLVAVLVIVVAAFYGKANTDWDWVDIFGEGSVLAILLVVYARVARTALVSALASASSALKPLTISFRSSAFSPLASAFDSATAARCWASWAVSRATSSFWW